MSKIIAPNTQLQFIVSEQDNDIRLDTFLFKQLETYSRSYIKKLIIDNAVSINGRTVIKPGYDVKMNDKVDIKFPEIKDDRQIIPDTTNLGVKLIFEHADFLVIDKPAGVLVHEVQSNKDKITLVDWLLAKFKEISDVGVSDRPGIVHRLDMNTSGLIIVPRNNFAHAKFGDMFKNREIHKTYLAVVQGIPKESGSIDFPIIRHPSGVKMSCLKQKISKILPRNARASVTHYNVLEYFKDAALIEVKPVTGRTHQIRVHLSCIGHPIIGDEIYGKKSKLINRQALHAYKLEFDYDGQNYNIESEIPQDFRDLINNLKD